MKTYSMKVFFALALLFLQVSPVESSLSEEIEVFQNKITVVVTGALGEEFGGVDLATIF